MNNQACGHGEPTTRSVFESVNVLHVVCTNAVLNDLFAN